MGALLLSNTFKYFHTLTQFTVPNLSQAVPILMIWDTSYRWFSIITAKPCHTLTAYLFRQTVGQCVLMLTVFPLFYISIDRLKKV